MADSRDITGKNRKFTGTTGVKLPEGTTAQRVDEAGQLRFNTNTNLAEYYDGTDWKSIDAPPTITGFTLDGGSSVTSATVNRTSGDATIVISGSNFDTTSATVVFEPESGGSNVSVQTITRTNSSSFTVTVTRTDFLTANDPYAIKLTNGSGLAATLASAITANDLPVFATAADTEVLSTYEGQSAPFSETTIAATDADGDTITHTISAGSLPPGLALSTAGALTGTVSGSSIQNYTFTVQAATAGGNTTRQFVIAIIANPNQITATGGVTSAGIAPGDGYRYHVFISPGTFNVTSGQTNLGGSLADLMVVGGGAGGATEVGGGGGAGGVYVSTSHSLSPGPISVGVGGQSGTTGSQTPGVDGNDSNFGPITAGGGGGGGECGDGRTGGANGRPGPGGVQGSGGGPTGCGNPGSTGSGANALGSYPGTTRPGGSGNGAGGGGGAGSAGGPWPGNGNGANGGSGRPVTQFPGPIISPQIPSPLRSAFSSAVGPTGLYGGGGGGGPYGGAGGTGGPGGGGPGYPGPSGGSNQAGTPGVRYTGGGGGGGSPGSGSNPTTNGADGIVIIRYNIL